MTRAAPRSQSPALPQRHALHLQRVQKAVLQKVPVRLGADAGGHGQRSINVRGEPRQAARHFAALPERAAQSIQCRERVAGRADVPGNFSCSLATHEIKRGFEQTRHDKARPPAAADHNRSHARNRHAPGEHHADNA